MKPRPRDAIWFSVQFALLFLISLWVYSRGLPLYERVVCATANPILETLTPAMHVGVRDDGALTVWLVGNDGSRRVWVNPRQFDGIFVSLLLLPPLILATPFGWRRRLGAFGLGCALMYVINVAALILALRMKLCLVESGGRACSWFYWLALVSGQLGAVGVWALVAWPFWLRRR